ncbi:hypothetical protein Q5H93_15745 [Hymenobacter sp. ASUV-10]|uniref:Uncharacterized protein n=1 Tax=Hymenobacter aranciens TaxID=3063996 RepID=A0ABT9BD70_9BACT|nr:hypothetical protein [Hymenobacter sp. ASUV-10]MDO7876198.1 hypothetical protein [Hymenobacter sp. ASUV-10]
MLRWLGLSVVAGLGLAACSGVHDPHKPVPATAAKSAPVPVEYDVPSLLGLNAAELIVRLGPPVPAPADYHDPVTLPLEQRGSPNDSTALFQAGKLPIVATFDAKSHQVIDLVVVGPDEERLMQQANLDLNARDYLLLAVFKARPVGKFLGFRVVARNLPQP